MAAAHIARQFRALLGGGNLSQAESPSDRSIGWRIWTDTASVGSFTTFVKLAGAVKTIVIALFFGTGDALDAYLIAFLIPSFAADVLSGALNPALMPTLIDVRENGSSKTAESIYADTLYRSTLWLCVVSVAIVLCAPALLRIVASGFDSQKLALTHALLLVMIPLLPLSAVGAVWRSVLNAKERFAIAAVSPVMTPVVMIGCLFAGANTWGIYMLAAGTIIGAMVELLILAVALRRESIPVFPRWRRDAARAHPVRRQWGPIAASNFVMGGVAVVNQSLAAGLGSGSVSILNFGTRLVSVILAIGPAALGTATLPQFSILVARRRWALLKSTIAKSLLISTLVMAVITAILIGVSEPIVQIALQRGAFTLKDTHAVSNVQLYTLLQLPFAIGSALLMRVVASLKINHVLPYVSVIAVVVNALVGYLLMQRNGIIGIALSLPITHGLILFSLALLAFRYMRGRSAA